MLAYNKKWLDALLIKKEAEKYFSQKWISVEKMEKIKSFYSDYFISHTFFARMGMFFFTSVIAVAIIGLFFLMFNLRDSRSVFLFFSILAFGSLFMVIQKNHYKSGIDDALLYIALLFLALSIPIDFTVEIFPYSLFLIILIIASILFADMLLVIAAWYFFFAILFHISHQLNGGMFARTLIMVFFGSGIYFSNQYMLKIEKFHYWQSSLLVVKILALLTIYYGTIHTIDYESIFSEKMDQTEITDNIESSATESASINSVRKSGFSFFTTVLYITSILIPLLYIGKSLTSKDRILLIIGLVTFLHSIFFKIFSIHRISFAYLALFSGVFLLCLGYIFIRYLAKTRYGFIYKDDNERVLDSIGINKDAEQIITTNILSNTTESSLDKPDSSFNGGGGKFGGGGAEGNF